MPLAIGTIQRFVISDCAVRIGLNGLQGKRAGITNLPELIEFRAEAG
jgi:hypothetical protein